MPSGGAWRPIQALARIATPQDGPPAGPTVPGSHKDFHPLLKHHCEARAIGSPSWSLCSWIRTTWAEQTGSQSLTEDQALPLIVTISRANSSLGGGRRDFGEARSVSSIVELPLTRRNGLHRNPGFEMPRSKQRGLHRKPGIFFKVRGGSPTLARALTNITRDRWGASEEGCPGHGNGQAVGGSKTRRPIVT